jgi:hypothetical protein
MQERGERRAVKRFLLAVLATLGFVLTSPIATRVQSADAGTASPTVKVWFLVGEQLVSVVRPGSTPQAAVQALIKGPSVAEYKLGYRTYVPPATVLRSLTVAHGEATVDLSLNFALGNAQSLDARLSQLVHTASGFDGVTRVHLLIDGGTAYGMFPGVVTALPITLEQLETPAVPVWTIPNPAPGPAVPDLLAAQRRLVALGFLLPGDADGKDDKVVRVIPVSTGKPSTPTPAGNFKVYAKFAKWWSTPFQEWLLWAVPFNGGVAFHEFPQVPAYAASHGCVRQMATTARWLYNFSVVGMPVKVIGNSK